MNRRRKRLYTKKKKKRDVTVIGAVKKNKKGFGFIELAEQKIFIPSEWMNGAMDIQYACCVSVNPKGK